MPEISCRNKVGVVEYKNELDVNVRLMPNPNNGQFSILATLSKEQDLTFKIFNYMGQLIGSNIETRVLSRVFDIDMSNNANGVYFIEISNGTQKTVKKMVISK
jgi:trimeric autotransporter adhesin